MTDTLRAAVEQAKSLPEARQKEFAEIIRMLLAYDADGNRVTQTSAINSSNQRVITTRGRDADGDLDYLIRSAAELDGGTITNYYDENGDHQYERTQAIGKPVVGARCCDIMLYPVTHIGPTRHSCHWSQARMLPNSHPKL